MDANATRTCPACMRSLPPDGFYRDRSRPDGRTTYCKECTKLKNAASYRRNREPNRAACRRYYERNRERLLAERRERHAAMRAEEAERINARRAVFNSGTGTN